MWAKALRPVEDGVVMRIEVSPGSDKSEWRGYDEWRNVFRIRLDAQPRKDKANKALIGFVSEALGLPSSRVRIISGTKSRLKEVLVQSEDIKTVHARLGEVMS